MKNGVGFVFALVVVLVTISLLSEARRGKTGTFGRLYERRTVDVDTKPTREPMMIVKEESIPESAPDPMLVESIDRSEILGVDPLPPHPPSLEEPIAMSGVAPLGEYDGAEKKPGKARFEIVGGSAGVRVKVQESSSEGVPPALH